MVFKTIITLFAAIASIEAGIGHVSYAAYPYSFPLSYPYAVPAQYAAVRAVAPVAPVATAPLVKALPAVPAVPAVQAVRAAPFVRALPAVPAVQAVAPAPVVRAAPFVAPVVKSAIAPVAAAPIAAAPVAAAKIDYADAYPQYQYAYSIQDVITGDNKAQEEIREGDVVKGRYSLLEADGSRRTVDYYADPLNGFNAIVQKELPVVAAAPVVKAPVAVAA